MVQGVNTPRDTGLPAQSRQYEWREQDGRATYVRVGATGSGRDQLEDTDPLPPKRQMPTYSLEEVKRHNTPDDLWFIVAGKVYDVSKWARFHPGGRLCLENLAGADATDAFENYHPAYVYQTKLPRFQIGVVESTYEDCEFVEEFRTLRQRLLAEGKFETDPRFYYAHLAFEASILILSLYLLLAFESMTAHMLSAVALGCFFQQVAFIGHDIGHNAVSHVKSWDHILAATLGNTFGGVSIGWWKWSHNVHHVITNSVEHDPDIQHLPIFAVTKKIFKPFYSTFHGKLMEMDTIAKFLVQQQHRLYYVIMALARFNLYAQSIILLVSNENFPYKRLELACCLLFHALHCTLLSYLPTWTEVILFLLVSNGIAGILHVQITLSHFSMDTFHGRKTFTSEEDNWFNMQVDTSMDIKTSWWNEWFHGGLQYQVEHHLFPRLPRQSLPYAQKLVMEFAARHNRPYHIKSFIDANKHVLAALKKAAGEASQVDAKPVFTRSMLWDVLNARG